MRRSTDNILPTHAGSLTRREALRRAWSKARKITQEEADPQRSPRRSFARSSKALGLLAKSFGTREFELPACHDGRIEMSFQRT
jgi:hypothetical protein